MYHAIKRILDISTNNLRQRNTPPFHWRFSRPQYFLPKTRFVCPTELKLILTRGSFLQQSYNRPCFYVIYNFCPLLLLISIILLYTNCIDYFKIQSKSSMCDEFTYYIPYSLREYKLLLKASTRCSLFIKSNQKTNNDKQTSVCWMGKTCIN